MRQINDILAAGDTAGVRALGYSGAQVAALLKPNGTGEIGFSDKTLADIEARIEELKKSMPSERPRESDSVSEFL